MISSNNTQAGEVACQYIADRLKGQGSVVILNGTPMDSINQRVSGCEKSLSKYPNIKLISKDQNAEGTRDGGLRVMSDLLTTFPKIDAVFATNDQSGVGADLAARQARRKEFLLLGLTVRQMQPKQWKTKMVYLLQLRRKIPQVWPKKQFRLATISSRVKT